MLEHESKSRVELLWRKQRKLFEFAIDSSVICLEIIKNPAFLPYVTNIDNSNLIENDISIFSILHTYVLQEKLLFNAYMFRLYIKSLLNHSAISNKKVICLLHTRLEYSNLNF